MLSSPAPAAPRGRARVVAVGVALAGAALLLAPPAPKPALAGPQAPAVPQAAERPPIAATLADVAFMAGHWVGGEPGDLSEEVWVAPEGDSMLGMWRFVAKGQTRIYEILTLTTEGDHVVLRIRHFNPRLHAREEKERPVELPLVAKGPGEAVFEGPEYNVKGVVRLTYRQPTPDSLQGVLEKEGTKQDFNFRKRR
jgi:hypothetical protein